MKKPELSYSNQLGSPCLRCAALVHNKGSRGFLCAPIISQQTHPSGVSTFQSLGASFSHLGFYFSEMLLSNLASDVWGLSFADQHIIMGHADALFAEMDLIMSCRGFAAHFGAALDVLLQQYQCLKSTNNRGFTGHVSRCQKNDPGRSCSP